MLVHLTFTFLLCWLIWFSLISVFLHHTRATQEAPLRTSVETAPYGELSAVWELLGMAEIRQLSPLSCAFTSGRKEKNVLVHFLESLNSSTSHPVHLLPHTQALQNTLKNVVRLETAFLENPEALWKYFYKFQTISLFLLHNPGQHPDAKLPDFSSP